MCVIFVAWKTRPDAPIVVAANRDEAHDRPAEVLHRWDDCPGVIAGRDSTAGGTWMGTTDEGRWAALTNIRDPRWMGQTFERSRGHIVSNFLCGTTEPEAYAREVQREREHYPGFNLLVGDQESLFFVSRGSGELRQLEPGYYGLSNADLDDPWPKVARGGQAFQEWAKSDLDYTGGIDLLNDRTLAPDDLLPDTGVGLELERLLSPLFIKSEEYGTRASTVLIVRPEESSCIIERSYGAGGVPTGEEQILFTVKSS